jgi:hypothetical protein
MFFWLPMVRKIDTALRKRPDLGAYSAKAAGSQRLYGNTSNEKMR